MKNYFAMLKPIYDALEALADDPSIGIEQDQVENLTLREISAIFETVMDNEYNMSAEGAKPLPGPMDIRRSGQDENFDVTWDVIKFWDNCPKCLGDAAKCPSPQLPMHQCPTRKNAIKHMKRGKRVVASRDY